MQSQKIKALWLIVVMFLALLIPLVLLEARRTPDWQAELARYLERSGTSGVGEHLVDVAEAQHPEQLDAQLVVAAPTGWAWEGIDVPLPEKLRCVRIAEEPERRYLFVGYHSDGLWHMGWLVHAFCECAGEEEKLVLLDKLGCSDWRETAISIRSAPTSTPRHAPSMVQFAP
jgi:hypothetical protein